MTYEDGLQFVKSLKKNYKAPSHFGIAVIDFLRQGYARQGFEETYHYLKTHQKKNRPFLDVLEEFRYFSDDLACLSTDPKVSFAWSVIHDVATEILDDLIMEEENKY